MHHNCPNISHDNFHKSGFLKEESSEGMNKCRVGVPQDLVVEMTRWKEEGFFSTHFDVLSFLSISGTSMMSQSISFV